MLDEPATLTWDPPGPGTWTCETDHKRTSQTVALQGFFPQAVEDGFRSFTGRYGLPISHLAIRYVNGYAYGQIQAAGAPDRSAGSSAPPRPVLFLLARLHPELRRRARAATETLATRRWRADVARWNEVERDAQIRANLILQDEDPGELDDAALAAHLERAAANARAGMTAHFSRIAVQLPVGELLATMAEWGIDPGAATALLAGASPASTEAAASLRTLAAAVSAAGVTPTTIDDIRGASPEAAEALSAHIRMYGWRLVTGSDLDARALVELPDLIVAAVNAALGAAPSEAGSTRAEVDRVRRLVPEADRPRFDELLAEARSVYGVREDDVTIGGSWTLGLLRRTLLEAGRRLARTGRIDHEDHAFDLRAEEAASLLRSGAEPTSAELSRRAADRRLADGDTPPPVLGPPPSPPPSPDVFPAAMARLTGAMFMIVSSRSRKRDQAPMSGTGIGTAPYRGRACVASDAGDAIERLQPGDVLVTHVTTPAFNGIIPLAGALVTEQGGLLSHPAIAAREHGIAAVVGVPGAVGQIPDGTVIEVDPTCGTVKVAS